MAVPLAQLQTPSYAGVQLFPPGGPYQGYRYATPNPAGGTMLPPAGLRYPPLANAAHKSKKKKRRRVSSSSSSSSSEEGGSRKRRRALKRRVSSQPAGEEFGALLKALTEALAKGAGGPTSVGPVVPVTQTVVEAPPDRVARTVDSLRTVSSVVPRAQTVVGAPQGAVPRRVEPPRTTVPEVPVRSTAPGLAGSTQATTSARRDVPSGSSGPEIIVPPPLGVGTTSVSQEAAVVDLYASGDQWSDDGSGSVSWRGNPEPPGLILEASQDYTASEVEGVEDEGLLSTPSDVMC